MKTISRRSFIKYGLCAAASFSIGGLHCGAFARAKPEYREALFYKKMSDGTIACRLCFRECMIQVGGRGFCRNRENREGKLYSLVYGRPSRPQLDPIEKEPMYHMFPGSKILCTGTAGCNFRCKFCQNWHLSQKSPEEFERFAEELQPNAIVEAAESLQAGLSFTYNEPTVFYEFMHDISKLGKERGLITIFHTNGGMKLEPMKMLLKHMMGVTVDLKGFTADFYKDASFAEMTPVLETLQAIKKEGKWLEVVNLLIPTLNDNMQNVGEMCRWIKNNLGDTVPVHFLRFFPAYKMTKLPPTPVKTLEMARDVAVKAGLQYVYIGNVPGHKYNSTFCPRCEKSVILRYHFTVMRMDVKKGKCKYCGYLMPGLWEM